MPEISADERAMAIAALPMEEVAKSHGFWSGTGDSIRDIVAHRDLLGLLIRRELRARYKDSSLGVLWSLVRPLAQLLIYYFAIGGILGLAKGIPDFAIFVYVGLTAWTFFVEMISAGTNSVVDNSGLVKKVYLPREIFPLSSVGGALFNFAVQFAILLAATAVLGRFPISVDILYAPLSIVVILVFGTAIALFLSAWNVYLRDVQHLVEVAILVLFWASPIVYSFKFVDAALKGNWLEQVYLANPVTLVVLGMQKAIWVAGSHQPGAQNFPPNLEIRLLIALAVSLILLWLGQRVFSRLQGNFAQEL